MGAGASVPNSPEPSPGIDARDGCFGDNQEENKSVSFVDEIMTAHREAMKFYGMNEIAQAHSDAMQFWSQTEFITAHNSAVLFWSQKSNVALPFLIGYIGKVDINDVDNNSSRERGRGFQKQDNRLPDTMMSINMLSRSVDDDIVLTLTEQGHYEQAGKRLEESLEKQKTNSMKMDSTKSESEETLMNMNNLAILYHEQGKYKEAEALYLECFEARKTTLGLNHSETKNTFHNLKVLLNVYKSQGDNEAARILEEKLRNGFR